MISLFDVIEKILLKNYNYFNILFLFFIFLTLILLVFYKLLLYFK